MSDAIREFLRQTSFPEDLVPVDMEWMDEIEPLEDFFTWLSSSVSARNCITPKDLKLFNVLSEHDKLIEKESLKSEYDSCFSGSANLYAHQEDIILLENIVSERELQLTQLQDYQSYLKKEIGELKKRKKCQKVADLYEKEFEETNNFILGEYQLALRNFATSYETLSMKLNSVTENGSSSEWFCLASLDKTYRLLDYLKTYASNLMKVFDEELMGGICRESGRNRNLSYFNKEFVSSNLRRVYHSCALLKKQKVKLEAVIKGLEAALDLLDNPDFLTAAIVPSSNVLSETDEEDIDVFCYKHVKVFLNEIESEAIKDSKGKYYELLAKLNELKEVAVPLTVCGKTVVSLLRNEWRWVRMARSLLNDSSDTIAYIHENILVGHENISCMQSIHELSYHSSDLEDNLRKKYNAKLNELLRAMGNSSADILKLLITCKTTYDNFFPDASATPQLRKKLNHFILALIENEEKLRALKQNYRDALRRFHEIKVHRESNLQVKLQDLFWFFYRQDPHKLGQVIEAVGKEWDAEKRYLHLASEEEMHQFLCELNDTQE